MIDPGRPPLVAWLHRNDRLALRLLPWVVGTALALGLAGALGGLEAFGLTIGVLAAAQAVWGGWRIEAAAKRIDRRAKAEDKAALVSALVDAERTVGRWAEAMDSTSPGRRQADVFRKAGPEIQAARAVLVVARIRGAGPPGDDRAGAGANAAVGLRHPRNPRGGQGRAGEGKERGDPSPAGLCAPDMSGVRRGT